MTNKLIEERVREYKGSLQNKQALRRTLTNLFDKAKKGNWAWNKLEQDWGFDGDYAGPQDFGNELINNN